MKSVAAKIASRVAGVELSIFSQEIEAWENEDLQKVLEASPGEHSTFWEQRLQLIKEELAARIAYQL